MQPERWCFALRAGREFVRFPCDLYDGFQRRDGALPRELWSRAQGVVLLAEVVVDVSAGAIRPITCVLRRHRLTVEGRQASADAWAHASLAALLLEALGWMRAETTPRMRDLPSESRRSRLERRCSWTPTCEQLTALTRAVAASMAACEGAAAPVSHYRA